MRFALPIVLASLAPWACSQSSDFSGGAKRTAAEQAACDADADTVVDVFKANISRFSFKRKSGAGAHANNSA